MPEDGDLALIVEAARGAGDIARRHFGGHFRRWDKGRGQPVTEADLEIDRFLQDTLTGARGQYGWLSEESVDNPERLEAERTFVVDPIDGTVAFVKGKPHFTISIAVVENGRPIAAVVYNPILEECYAAQTGRGTTLNGVPIHTSACAAVQGCRMLAPKSLFEHPAWTQPPLTPWPPMELEQRNSIAYRLALVAAGRFDATLALSAKNDWDLAAGDLLVREAGGLVTDHRGALLRYNGPVPIQHSVVAAGSSLQPLLLMRVRDIKNPEE